jgi:hypothetical protein
MRPARVPCTSVVVGKRCVASRLRPTCRAPTGSGPGPRSGRALPRPVRVSVPSRSHLHLCAWRAPSCGRRRAPWRRRPGRRVQHLVRAPPPRCLAPARPARQHRPWRCPFRCRAAAATSRPPAARRARRSPENRQCPHRRRRSRLRRAARAGRRAARTTPAAAAAARVPTRARPGAARLRCMPATAGRPAGRPRARSAATRSPPATPGRRQTPPGGRPALCFRRARWRFRASRLPLMTRMSWTWRADTAPCARCTARGGKWESSWCDHAAAGDRARGAARKPLRRPLRVAPPRARAEARLRDAPAACGLRLPAGWRARARRARRAGALRHPARQVPPFSLPRPA